MSALVRVVLLAPDDERVRLLGILYTYAGRAGFQVDSIAGTLADALAAVSAGLADRVLAVDARALGPLIEIADPQIRHARADLESPSMPDHGADVPPSQRRPRRLT